MDIEILASVCVAVGALARLIAVIVRKEPLERAFARIVVVAGSAGAVFVGAITAPASWLVHVWPDSAKAFYGNWLSNPTFLFIAGMTWALAGALGVSAMWPASR